MRISQKRRLYCFLFLAIFFAKMAISIGPIYANFYDSEHVMAVILQLEIENNSDKANTNDSNMEKFAKEFTTYIDWNIFLTPLQHLFIKKYITDEDTHIKSFYPSVPTPPPNC